MGEWVMSNEVDTEATQEVVESQTDAPETVAPEADATAAEQQADATAAAAAEQQAATLSAEEAALLDEIQRLPGASQAERVVAADRLNIDADQLAALAASLRPAQTTTEAVADPLAALPEEVQPALRAIVNAIKADIAPLRTELQTLREAQSKREAAEAERAARAEFDAIAKDSPVFKLLQKRGQGDAFVSMVETETQRVWNDRVRATQSHYTRLGRQLSIEQAASLTPSLSKADFEAARERAAQPFRAFAEATRPGTALRAQSGAAAVAQPPPVSGRTGISSGGLPSRRAVNGATAAAKYDPGDKQQAIRAIAAELERLRPVGD